jgi:transposase
VNTAPDIAAFEAVRAENGTLRRRLAAAEAQAAAGRKKLARLEHELAQLKRLVFGTKSERFEPLHRADQASLFGGEVPVEAPAPEVAAPVITRKAPARKPVRQVLPSHLPREVVVIEPETDTSALRKIGEDVTETLDYRPAKLIVLRRVRPKYVDAKREERGVIVAELPPRPVEKGMAEPGLLAHVVIEKYVDHLPLYRQVQRFKRQGITIADSTLGGWITTTAELLVPLYEALRREVVAGGYIQADETPIPVQDQDKKGTTHRGYYWVYHAPEPGLVVMDYQEGRGRAGPAAWLAGYEGALQSDGYAAYEHFDRLPGITTCGCWAHARRYFFEAKDNDAEKAEHALTEIRRLYAIEREIAGASPEERRRVRQERAVLVLDTLKTWLEANPGLPKSPWGKAVSYALARWEKLTRYANDGRIEIDNNLVENAIRPVALGRKNYLFAGSHDAAQRAAVIYSLLAACKKHDVNPQVWLTDVLVRIPSHPHKQVADLLPHHWKARKG